MTFDADRTPVQENLILGLTHTDTRVKYASAIPGTLKPAGENRFEAAFPTEPFSGYLHFAGSYDFILGGVYADGTAFQCVFEITVLD